MTVDGREQVLRPWLGSALPGDGYGLVDDEGVDVGSAQQD
jgi:hypothetical protein